MAVKDAKSGKSSFLPGEPDEIVIEDGFCEDYFSSGISPSQLAKVTAKTNSKEDILRISDLITTVHIEKEPRRAPTYAKTDITKAPQILSVLNKNNIFKLYEHQAKAIETLRLGKNVVLTTETASGKSLVYIIPFLEEVLKDPKSTGIFIFPTKALSNDQLKNLESYGIASIKTYDGSLPAKDKAKIRKNPPNVIFTNPDTIHHSMLFTCRQWTDFFKNLKMIVLDEIHLYKGYFGSNVSNIIHRLMTLVKNAGGNPRIVCTSATIQDAGEFAKELCHENFDEISSSSSGQPSKEYVFIQGKEDPKSNLPMVGPRGILIYLATLMGMQGKQGIVFVDSKKEIDLLTLYLRAFAKPFKLYQYQIEGYHADKNHDERQDIEKRIKNKEVLIVISTSALEIGIDIGSFDYCILYGIPKFSNQIWQRIGRVGRNSNRDVAISIINRYSYRDSYYFQNPSEFFKTKNMQNKPVIYAENDRLQELHQLCGYYEGMQKNETLKPPIWDTIDKSDSKIAAYKRISIRKPWQEDYDLIDDSTNEKIGEVEYERVFREFHKYAIVNVAGARYSCDYNVDYKKKDILLSRVITYDHYTTPDIQRKVSIDIASIREQALQFDEKKIVIGEGKVTVEISILGMIKHWFWGERQFQEFKYPPEKNIKTKAFWLSFKNDEETFKTLLVIHTLEHLLQRAIVDKGYCDWPDIGGITIEEHPMYSAPTLFIYENMIKGMRMSEVFYSNVVDLIERARQFVKLCPCENGCPQCIHIPNYCDEKEFLLSKQDVMAFLDELDFSTVEKTNLESKHVQKSREFINYDRNKFKIGDIYVDDWKVIDKTEDEYVIENPKRDKKFILYEDTPL